MAYLLDSDVFIQAKNLHYGFDFCPAFRDWLLAANARGEVFSTGRVRDELVAGADSLADWARARNPGFFVEPDAQTLPHLARVSQWTLTQNYEPAAINTFLQVADYYLVSQALARGYVVVTHEVPGNSPRRIKIPEVCIGLNVRCINPFEMLRRAQARFVLG